jgi:FixJ family two-component response regulator
MQAGAVTFFQKPVEDDELLLALRKDLDVARGGVSFSN